MRNMRGMNEKHEREMSDNIRRKREKMVVNKIEKKL